MNREVMIALSAAELSELTSCETVIEHGLKIFQAVGVALITIREKRLYRAEFKTFEDYCATKWGFTDERARLLMRGAEVVENIGKTPTIVGVLPANEAQVRPLITLTPDQQREAWHKAVSTAPNGKMTGAHVEEVARQFKPTNSRPAGVRSSSAGAEPDLDEDGLPLVQHMDSVLNERRADQVKLDEDDEDTIGVGDTVQYRGQTYKVRASGSKVWLDVPARHPLRSEGLEPDEVVLIERAAKDTSPPAPSPKRGEGEKPAPLAEEIVQLDGVPVAESHPMGWQLFFIETSWATCVNCGESHPRWSFVRGGDWRCEHCKRLTHDDLLIPYTKADAVAEERSARRSNGHKPPVKDPLMTSESSEWYTPEDFVALVRQVLGTIDVDPASCAAAQAVVQADDWYDETADGLAQLWFGTVYLNPPYGRDIGDWVEKLIGEYKRNLVSEAILLTPARTDTEWFRLLRAYPRCFVSGRLKFWNSSDPTPNSAPFPSAVFYLGGHPAKFAQVFSDIGDIYSLWSE